MAKYYNRSSGGLSVTLRSGASTVLPSRVWVNISAEDEGSEDLASGLRKGVLVRHEEGKKPFSSEKKNAKAEESSAGSENEKGGRALPSRGSEAKNALRQMPPAPGVPREAQGYAESMAPPQGDHPSEHSGVAGQGATPESVWPPRNDQGHSGSDPEAR